MGCLARAKNGMFSFRENKILLHSAYNPKEEAERYIASLDIPSSATDLVLLSPGLGYMIPVLRGRHPDKKIIALYCGCGIKDARDKLSAEDDYYKTLNADAEFYGCGEESSVDLVKFLESETTEDSELKIIEWRPSLAAYGESYCLLLKAVLQYINGLEAGKRTETYFAQRWKKNTEHNLKIKNTVSFLDKPCGRRPIIVLGAGTSLNAGLGLLKNIYLELNPYIIACSSSLYFLLEHNIIPQLVVLTDGGYWAAPHFFPFHRAQYHWVQKKTNFEPPVFCAALNAYIPTFLYNEKFFFFSHNANVEYGASSGGAKKKFPYLMQRGTVAATAMDIACVLSSGKPIFVCGIDLGCDDVKTHAKPHVSDCVLFEKASRFSPFYNKAFVNMVETNEGKTLDIYKNWFRSHEYSFSSPVYALSKSSPASMAAPLKNISEAAELA
jgi:hypothetical protein